MFLPTSLYSMLSCQSWLVTLVFPEILGYGYKRVCDMYGEGKTLTLVGAR